MYLSADTFGPIFALVEKWAYLQGGTRGDEGGGELTRGDIRYMIRYVVLYFQ